jgi:hypothetical protein
MNAEERRRVVAEIRERAAEAAIAHSAPDDQCELALLGMELDDEHDVLQRLGHDDPVGACWFAVDDEWIDRQLARQDAPK